MSDQIGGNDPRLFDSGEDEYEPETDFTVVTNRSKAEREIERTVTPRSVRDFSRSRNNVLEWEVDPKTLRDYAENSIVQAFIDTLAKDVSSINWDIVDGDGESIDDIKDLLKNAHPEKTFRDMIEAVVRDLLETGNAFWVIHRYKNSDEVAEIAMPDASSMFKVIDDDGYLEGFAQKTKGKRANVIPKENVIYFPWSSASDRNYARSPVETAMDQIDIIEELLLKEQLDLIEGGVSSIISQSDDHETNPLSNKEWKRLKNEVTQQEGSRHVNVITRGSFERTEIGTNYEDLNLLERYKTHIQTIGAAFKVSAAYAGLDYENTNRATDENQTQNYLQKGIKITLQQIKSRINKDLIPELTDDDSVRFSWSMETSRDTDEVQYYQQLAQAVIDLKEAGVPFEVSDNNITIPEGAEVSFDELQAVEEAQVLNELSNKEIDDILEEIEETQNKEDERWKEVEYTETDRKKELADVLDAENFAHAIYTLDNDHGRTKGFEKAQEELSGTLSKSTYYNWLEEVGLKE